MNIIRSLLGMNGSTKPNNQKIYASNTMEIDNDDNNGNIDDTNDMIMDIGSNKYTNNNDKKRKSISKLLITNNSTDKNNNININDDFPEVQNNNHYSDDDEYDEGPYGYNINIQNQNHANEVLINNVRDNELKKRKKVCEVLKGNNVETKQRTTNYRSLQNISSSLQVPKSEVAALRKTMKENNNMIPNEITVSNNFFDNMFKENTEWIQDNHDNAVNLLILNEGKSQKDISYNSISDVSKKCKINERAVKNYKKILNDNGNLFFSPVEPLKGRPKAQLILTEAIIEKIKADPRIKFKGASDETTTRIIWDAMKSDARENEKNPFAIQEPVYDASLKLEMNEAGFLTDRKAQAKTKARLEASGDFFSMIAAGAMYFVCAYYTPIDSEGIPTGAIPEQHIRRISPTQIINADMTAVMVGNRMGDKGGITILASRQEQLESIGLSGVFNRTKDSENTQSRSIGLYPAVSLSGDFIAGIFCITEETLTKFEIITLKETVPEALFVAARPPNQKDNLELDNTAFMAEIHSKCMYPTLLKWREYCVERECTEIDEKLKAGMIDQLMCDELKVECYAKHAYTLFTADGDYAQVNMMNLDKIKQMVREMGLIDMKWSAGCSLLQNALDKAKSYMLMNKIVDDIKNIKGFHAHETPPTWYERLQNFTKRIFSKASAATIDTFFSHAPNMLQTIFKRSIIQEGFKFTGFGNEFSLDTILGQYYEYGEWSEDKRNTVHNLFWSKVVPKAYNDRCLDPEFLHGVFKEVLEYEDFDIMYNKAKRPLNGQYACELSPAVIKRIEEKRTASLELIHQEREKIKLKAADARAIIKAAEKKRNDELKEPTISKRNADIKKVENESKLRKNSIKDNNKNTTTVLTSSTKNAKTPALKKQATVALDQHKKNIKEQLDNEDNNCKAIIKEIKKNAANQIKLILQSAGTIAEGVEDIEDGDHMEEDDEEDDNDNNDND